MDEFFIKIIQVRLNHFIISLNWSKHMFYNKVNKKIAFLALLIVALVVI